MPGAVSSVFHRAVALIRAEKTLDGRIGGPWALGVPEFLVVCTSIYVDKIRWVDKIR